MNVYRLQGPGTLPGVREAYGRLCESVNQSVHANPHYNLMARPKEAGWYTKLFNDELHRQLAEFNCTMQDVWLHGIMAHGLDLDECTLTFKDESDLFRFVLSV